MGCPVAQGFSPDNLYDLALRDHSGAGSEFEPRSAFVSSLRELMSSFVKTLDRCHSTVRWLRKSCSPISGFVRPS